MTITELWYSADEKDWAAALNRYWQYVRPENLDLERKMESLEPNSIKTLNVEEFYEFLFNEFFVWKYTAKNRLATTRNAL